MPEKKSKKISPQKKLVQAETRTHSIPVQESKTFSLGVNAAKAPNEVLKTTATPESPAVSLGTKPSSGKPPLTPTQQLRRQNSHKVWNLLEWLATSALIFVVLFFVINFSSYSTILVDKLDQLRGTVQTSPFVKNILQTQPSTTDQKPLPLIQNAQNNTQQIPGLSLEVVPPDDRIIVPRIKQNVPVVKVNTENLIKRDWSALEKDIQESLREGVVHYPGTAEPGENGNVVITGHSSYFPWDPGRFKDVFALLTEVVVGDKVVVYHDQKKYIYEVYERKIVTPDKIDVLTQKGDNRLTLITCYPVGTNLKRLVLLAKPA